MAALRARKQREDKPFALMVADAGRRAARWSALDARRAELLRSAAAPDRARPAPRRRAGGRGRWRPGARARGDASLLAAAPPAAAPTSATPLVMTSGNVSDEPIAYRDEDARRAAGRHRRPVAHPRPPDPDAHRRLGRARVAATARLLRRSRGYVPGAAAAAGSRDPAAAAGVRRRAEEHVLPGAGDRAWVSHHIGDLENYETLRSFTEGIAHFERLFAIAPEVVAHDLHPEYLSTKYALEPRRRRARSASSTTTPIWPPAWPSTASPGRRSARSSTAPASGPTAPCGAASSCDGDLDGFRRVGRCARCALPGGAAPSASRGGWRARGWRRAAPPASRRRCPRRWPARSTLAPGARSTAGRERRRLAADQQHGPAVRRGRARCAGSGARSPSRARRRSSWRPPATPASVAPTPSPFDHNGDRLVLDPRPAIRAAAADVDAGRPAGTVAARFHAPSPSPPPPPAPAWPLTAAPRRRPVRRGVPEPPAARRRLGRPGRPGLRVLVPERLPVNDGGIAYGQAAVAAATLSAPSTP